MNKKSKCGHGAELNANEDPLKELRAYNIGYDLGWFRALETVSDDLKKIIDAMQQSYTFQQIESESSNKPIFIMEIMNLIMDIQTMKSEKMPVLLLEREKINEIGKRIEKLPAEAFMDPTSFFGETQEKLTNG